MIGLGALVILGGILDATSSDDATDAAPEATAVPTDRPDPTPEPEPAGPATPALPAFSDGAWEAELTAIVNSDQLLDYRRHENDPASWSRGVLVPRKPTSDLVSFINGLNMSLAYPVSSDVFKIESGGRSG